MALDAYNKELKKILTNDAPPSPSNMTREEIQAAASLITAMLQGPLSNAERLALVEERRELRKHL